MYTILGRVSSDGLFSLFSGNLYGLERGEPIGNYCNCSEGNRCCTMVMPLEIGKKRDTGDV